MPTTRIAVLSITGLLAASVLAGCSSSAGSTSTSSHSTSHSTSSASSSAPAADLSNLSVTALLTRAKATLSAAKDVHIAGDGTSENQKFALDLSYTSSGTSGSVTIAADQIQIVVTGAKVYFKAPDDFWTKQAGSAAKAKVILAKVSGKWVEAPATNTDFAQFAAFGDKTKFTDSVLTPDSTPTKGATSTIDGVKCVSLNDGSSGTLYLAADDARPISITSTGSSSGKVTFDYGALPAVVPPPAAQTVMLANLAGS